MCENCEKLTAANAELTRERGEMRHSLLELLAVIHGDGGHYAMLHGIKQAAEDAATEYIAKITELDTLKTRLQSAESRGYLKAIEDAAGVVKEFADSAREQRERDSLVLLAQQIEALSPKGDTCEWKRTTDRGRIPVVRTTCGKTEIVKSAYVYCPHCGLPITIVPVDADK